MSSGCFPVLLRIEPDTSWVRTARVIILIDFKEVAADYLASSESFNDELLGSKKYNVFCDDRGDHCAPRGAEGNGLRAWW